MTAPPRAGATLRRHRLARIDRQIQEHLTQHRGITIDRGQRRRHLDADPNAVLVRLGLDHRKDLLQQRRDLHRLEPQILRSREFQEPLHYLIQAPDLSR